MRVGITVVDNNFVIAGNPRPALHRWYYSLVAADKSLCYGCACEMAADNTFVYERLADFEIAALDHLCHSRRCAGTTG